MSHYQESGACPNITTLSGLRVPMPETGATLIQIWRSEARSAVSFMPGEGVERLCYMDAPIQVSRTGAVEGVYALADVPMLSGKESYVFVPDEHDGFDEEGSALNGILYHVNTQNALGRRARSVGALRGEALNSQTVIAMREHLLTVRDGVLQGPYMEGADGIGALSKAVGRSIETYKGVDGESLPYARKQMRLLVNELKDTDGPKVAARLITENPELLLLVDVSMLDTLLHHEDSRDAVEKLTMEQIGEIALRWRRSGDHEMSEETLLTWLKKHPGSSAALADIDRGGVTLEGFERHMQTKFYDDGEYIAPPPAAVAQELSAVAAVAAGVAKKANVAPDCGEIATMLDIDIKETENAVSELSYFASHRQTADDIAIWRALDMDKEAIKLMCEAGVSARIALACSSVGLTETRQWKRLAGMHPDHIMAFGVEDGSGTRFVPTENPDYGLDDFDDEIMQPVGYSTRQKQEIGSKRLAKLREQVAASGRRGALLETKTAGPGTMERMMSWERELERDKSWPGDNDLSW